MNQEPPEKQSHPRLLVPGSEARERLNNRLERGRLIRDTPIHSEEELQNELSRFYKWNDFNRELLLRLFDNDSLAEEYSPSGPIAYPGPPLDSSFDEEVAHFRRRVSGKLLRLDSIMERTDLFPEPDDQSRSLPLVASQGGHSRKVLVVHGHDEGTKQAVARFLEKLQLTPVILHEQANQGRTLIEKFEAHASVGLAVVLLTPDDLGSSRDQPGNLAPRARQNVILELGFLMGALGRRRVCALYAPGVEIPSDYDGVVYIELDSKQGWRLQLAAEIKAAGLPIDLNRAL